MWSLCLPLLCSSQTNCLRAERSNSHWEFDTELNNSFHMICVYRRLPGGAYSTCPPEMLLLLHRTKLHLIKFTALIEMSCSRAQIHRAKDQTHLRQKGCRQLAKKWEFNQLQQTTQTTQTQMLNADLNVVSGSFRRCTATNSWRHAQAELCRGWADIKMHVQTNGSMCVGQWFSSSPSIQHTKDASVHLEVVVFVSLTVHGL